MPRISGAQDLQAYLDRSVKANPQLEAAAAALTEIAAAAVKMSDLIGLGQLYGRLGASRDSANADGDVQKELDVLANEMFVEALRRAPVFAVVSEELPRASAARSDGAHRRLDGPARRLLEHRRQCVDRHHLFGAAGVAGGEQPRGAFSAAGARADRRRLRHLWPADVDRLRARRERDGDLHARSQRRPLLPCGYGRGDPAGLGRICDQRIQLPALGALDPRLHRGLRARRRRADEAQPQHALGRVARRRSLSHPSARRHFSLPRRPAAGLRRWAPAPAL